MHWSLWVVLALVVLWVLKMVVGRAMTRVLLTPYRFTSDQEFVFLLIWEYARRKCGLNLNALGKDLAAAMVHCADELTIHEAVRFGHPVMVILRYAHTAAGELGQALPGFTEDIDALAEALYRRAALSR